MKLLIVDIGSLFRAVSKKWSKRRLDYQKIWRLRNHDRALAVGYQSGKEAGSFMTVLKKLGYFVSYIKVPMKDSSAQERLNISAAVRITIKVLDLKPEELILGSNDPLLAHLMMILRDRLIPTHLIACDPCETLMRAACNRTLITEDMLLPIPEEGKRFPGNVQEQLDDTSEKS